ncbi:MAG: glycosyltransferase family 4 protein [Pseudomonadota bacterium]
MSLKPKILIIADVPGWAMERTADNVMARLKNHYHFEKAFNANAEEKIKQGDFDLLYITYETQFRDAGIKAAVPPGTVSGVRSHFKWDGGRGLPPAPEFIAYLQQFVALNVPSRILYDVFKNLHFVVFHTPHGVDHGKFHPRIGGAFSSPPGKLVLGWAGSKTNHPGKRGIEDYILPALEGLSGVSFTMAAREEKWRSQEEMVTFYQGLDAYICASRTEGGPHPILEALSCGIPVISTRVGVAPELIEQGVNGMLVERIVPAIREAIVYLRDNRDLRVEMGKQARKTIEENWTWDMQAQKYIPFFNYGFEKWG